jgi:hypothetical protein
MQQVISKWGQWTSLDTSDVVMPDFQRTDRGLFPLLFPELLAAHRTTSRTFLGHGKDLIERVKQGIYAEYGYDSSA